VTRGCGCTEHGRRATCPALHLACCLASPSADRWSRAGSRPNRATRRCSICLRPRLQNPRSCSRPLAARQAGDAARAVLQTQVGPYHHFNQVELPVLRLLHPTTDAACGQLAAPNLWRADAGRDINEAVMDAVALLRVPRSALGICASSRGAVTGCLLLRESAGSPWLDCSRLGVEGRSVHAVCLSAAGRGDIQTHSQYGSLHRQGSRSQATPQSSQVSSIRQQREPSL